MRRLSIIIDSGGQDHGILVQCLESALALRYGETEIVLVDDGEGDAVPRLLDDFGNRIGVVARRGDGQAAAFNSGYRRSTGDVVCFLNAEDRLMGENLPALLEFFDDPDVVQGHGPVMVADSSGRLAGPYPGRPLPRGDLRDRAIRSGPWSWPVVPGGANLWSRAFLEQVMPVPRAAFFHCADLYLLACAPLYGRLAATRRIVAQIGRQAGGWLGTLTDLQDVRCHARHFELWAWCLEKHARKLGLEVNPQSWPERDWRQQLRLMLLWRCGQAEQGPGMGQLMRAAWQEPAGIERKIMLMPALAFAAGAPRPLCKRVGLKLLQR